jgi:HAD superfamily hydrolase (TIGR01509 family)
VTVSHGRLAAVLLDMDGTLVDTEPDWIACEQELVAAYGGTWTDDDAHDLVGTALLAAAGTIAAVGGVPLPPEEIVQRLLDGLVERVRRRIPWMPGARELLDALGEAGVPLALVTMSYRRLADAVLEGLPPGTFGAVVTGDEVRESKPHAEPYLRAASLLGVDPRSCVAIEDSPTGVASAEAAGCVTVAVKGVLAVPAAPGRVVVDHLADLTVDTLVGLVDAGHDSG